MAGAGKFYLTGPYVGFVDLPLLKSYMAEMVKMSSLQGYSIEIVDESPEVRVIGSAPVAERGYNAAMRRPLSRALFSLGLFLLIGHSVRAQARPGLAAETEAPLAVDQTAELLGIADALRLVRQPSVASREDRLAAQQRVIASVTAASLEVDATTGQIDEEIAETHELQNYLSARRQREIDLLNLVSLGIGGSLGTASAALGLTPHVRASGVVGIISGTSITALSAAGLRVRKGGQEVLEARSNMLCHVFDLPSDSNNFYPASVAAFMAQAPPGGPAQVSRNQHLVQAWVKLGRIPPPETEKGKLKVARLASVPQQETKLSINDLDDRQAMLYDLRARVMYMKRDLALLMASASRVD